MGVTFSSTKLDPVMTKVSDLYSPKTDEILDPEKVKAWGIRIAKL